MCKSEYVLLVQVFLFTILFDKTWQFLPENKKSEKLFNFDLLYYPYLYYKLLFDNIPIYYIDANEILSFQFT